MKTPLKFNPRRGSKSSLRRYLRSLALPCALALLAQSVQARTVNTVYWTGGSAGTSTQWTNGTLWTNIVAGTSNVPGPTDSAVFVAPNFAGSALPANFNLNFGSLPGYVEQVGSITLNSGIPGSARFVLENYGTTLTSPGSLVLNGANGILISNADSSLEMYFASNTVPSGYAYGMRVILGASGAIYAAGNGSDVVSSAQPGRVTIGVPIGETNGSQGVTLTGPGNVYFLYNASTYSGSTVISNGALELDAVGTAGNGAGTIYLSGGFIQSAATRSGNPIANPIVLTSNSYIFSCTGTAGTSRYFAMSGPITGGTNTLVVCNPTPSVTGNTFNPRFLGGFTNTINLVIGDPSTDGFYNNAFNDTPGNFSAVDLGNYPTNLQVWNGTISGAGSIHRVSPTLANAQPGGSAILTGNNTYSGGTIIASGTLFANNTAGSALGSGNVIVTNQGILAGNGTVIASTVVSNSGALQPGATSSNIANLAISSLAIGPAASYTWQIGSATGTPGTAWDLITCSSGWTDAGTSTNPNTIYVTSKGITPTNWNSATSYSWMIIANNGSSTGFNASDWAINTTGFSAPTAGVFALTNDVNGDLLLTYTPASGTYLINVPSGSVAQGAVSPTPYPVLTGLYSVTKTGNGEVIMTNSLNTYQGATYIFAGTASAAVNSTTAGGAFGASSAPLVLGYTNGSSNATLNIDQPGVSVANAITVQAGSTGVKTIESTITSGEATYSGGVVLDDNVTLDALAGATNLFSGSFSGPGGINFTGGGTIIMSGLGSYTGPTTIGNVSLDLNSPALGTNTVTINSGVALDNTGPALVNLTTCSMIWNSGFTFTGTTNLNCGYSPVTLAANCIVTVNSNVLGELGPIGGAFGLTKAGPGELSINATNASTYTGGTTNLAGILGINDLSSFGNGTGPLVMAGGVLRGTASRTVPIANPTFITTTTRITGDSTAAAPSTRIMPFTGVWNVTGGSTLIVDNTGLASNTFAVEFLGSNYSTVNWPIQLGDATYDTAGSYTAVNFYNDNTTPVQTVSSLITGTGLVQRSATSPNTGGTSIFTAQNTFSGGFELYSGFLGLGASSTVSGGSVVSGPVGTGTFTIGNGTGAGETNLTVFAYGGAQTIANNVIFNGITNITFAGANNLTFAGPINSGTAAKTLEVLNTGLTTLSGPITNAGTVANQAALTITGTGTLVMSGANTYSGTTTVLGGTLLMNGNSSALTNAVTVSSGTFGGSGSLSGNVTYASGAQAYFYKTNGAPDSPLTLYSNLTLNGNTVIVDLGGTTTLGAGTYNLLTYAGTLTGTFGTTPTFVDGSLAPGNTGTISTATTGVVTLVVAAGSVTPPTIGQETVNGNQLVLSGTGGTAGGSYNIVTSTNVATALSNWVAISTNTFGANGGFTNTLTINTNEFKRFYRLKTP